LRATVDGHRLFPKQAEYIDRSIANMGGFGDFTSICQMAPLPLCECVGPIRSIASGVGIEADCFARNIELANTIIFQGAASAMHIVALVMTVIMILHVRGKFTAVGKDFPVSLGRLGLRRGGCFGGRKQFREWIG
jgi:hypothetical protein